MSYIGFWGSILGVKLGISLEHQFLLLSYNIAVHSSITLQHPAFQQELNLLVIIWLGVYFHLYTP